MIESGDQTAIFAFTRPERLRPPEFTCGEIVVTAPPKPPRPVRGAVPARTVPVVMAVAMIAMSAVVYRSGSPVTRNPAFLLFPVMMLVSAGVAATRGRGGFGNIDDDREEYLCYLAGLRGSVTETAAAQRASLIWCHPDPAGLWTLVGGPRMWERRAGDREFGRVRVGIGAARHATRLVAPQFDRAGVADPVTDTALRRFLHTHATVPDVPVTVGLGEPGAVSLDGEPDCVRGVLRAMVCQLAVLHGPDVLAVAAVVAERHRKCWDWLKWLPHHQHPGAFDGAGPARLTFPTAAAAEAGLAGLAGRHVVVVVDGCGAGGLGAPGCTVVQVGGGAGAGVRLQVTEATLTGPDLLARPDEISRTDATVCAQRLAGYRVGRPTGGDPHWAALLGLDELDDPDTRWAAVERRDALCVPVGTDPAGQAVWLDIKEAAERGTGPHGLCIGATGSGKSEFLRTVVLGMLARHSPETLNLVLVDFKGGATFLGLERVRHVAAVITNLADEAPLVDRMREALTGEMNRRQELLRAAGNFAGITAYTDARRAGAALPALPALLVIVDEFSELLSQQPDFVDTFVAIGRLGRSLGMHLLLASQRLDEGRLRGLEAHLSYRVCLKTMSANESRIVLGVPDAHQLPNTPGLGYLRTATGELTRFQTAFVSGPHPETGRPVRTTPPAVSLFSAAPTGGVTVDAPASGRPSTLQTVLDRLAGKGPPARQVWLAPLGESPTLRSLLDGESSDGELPELVVPIGIVDRPYEQRRTALLVDLRGAAGNAAVIGAPRSGKSTTLVTLVTALAATQPAGRVQLYCLDFGGGALGSLRSLPQVGSVAGRAEPELVRRTVEEMESIVARRELRGGRDPADPFGDVFLVIDGWAPLCRDFDRLEAPITALAGRGLAFGVHVVLSAARWAEIRPALRDLIGTRIELRLGDPADSELDRRQAERVPRDKPGRGLTHGGLHTLIALPRLDGPAPVGTAAPPIPLLPVMVPLQTLAGEAGGAPVLGVEERELGAVALDFDRQQHLLILGDSECGKTSTLRTLCRELVRAYTAEQVRLVVVDYRRGLLGVIEPDRLDGYAVSPAVLTALLPDLLDRLAQRMPGPGLTPAQLRDRSWWSGPQLYLLIDDYDLVATAAGNPLAPLLDYLPHAGDVGLHLVVARRSGGAARAMYEPVLAALRDLGAMGLMMSAGPDEGPLMGSTRPMSLPPGRGTLVTRTGGQQLVQVAWTPPP
ncbi:MAG: type VII secretion protein EccCa [Mycobacterium sp.]